MVRINRGYYLSLINFVKGIHETNDTPRGTAEQLVKSLGRERADVAVACLVNLVSDYDKRVDDSSREWAKLIEDAPTREQLEKEDIYLPGWIHPCHINQLAQEMDK